MYVVPFPGATRKIPISSGGGIAPRWSPDGKKLYYLRENGEVVESALQVGNGLLVSATTTLFKIGDTDYAVSHDGSRFLLFEDVPGQLAPSITLVYNWPKVLQK